MPWAPRLEHEFSPSVRTKGSSYAHSGSVTITSVEEDWLFAVVRGSRRHPYEVDFNWHRGVTNITCSCTCPHCYEGNFCKHLWATILWADQEGVSPQFAGNGRLHLVHEGDQEEYYRDECDEYDQYDDDYMDGNRGWIEEVLPRKLAAAALTTTNRPSGKAKLARDWHQEFASLGGPPSASKLSDLLNNRQQRVFYVVDVSESSRSGSLALILYHQESRKDGSWGKVKLLAVGRRNVNSFADADAEILALALGNRLADARESHYRYGEYAYDGASFSRIDLSPAVLKLLLPKLCDTGRFGWVMGSAQPPEDAQPLGWIAGNRWRPRIRIAADDKKKRWTLTGELVRDSSTGSIEQLPLAAPVLVLHSGAVMFEDRIGLFDGDSDFRWIQLLRKHETIEVPYADRQQLLASLCESTPPVDVVWPKHFEPQQVVRKPTGHLRIHPAADYSKLPSWQRPRQPELYADVHFKYGDHLVPPDQASRRLFDAQSEQFVVRDADTEAALIEHLRDLRIAPRVDRHSAMHLPGRLQFVPHRLPTIVSDLVGRGWEVEAEGHKIRPAGEFNIRVTSGVDWFDLDSNVDFGETTASLPALLAAAKSGDGYVLLDDGSRGMLPQAWIDRFAPLAEFAEVDGDRLRFKPSQAMLLDALLDERHEQLSIEVDRQFANFRKRLASFSGIQPAKPPRGFRGQLRPYQQQGLGWLKFLEEFALGGCLADDMGLGKTVQVLALLLARRQRRLPKGEARLPSLVVAPKSVVVNWQLEAERFAPTLTVLNYTGLERKTHQQHLADYNVIVTTYGTLRRDIELLRHQPLDYVVLDEAQAIKNDNSQSAKACRLLDARHRLTLTGTPVENHLGELWSQFEFLNPGMLGRSTRFSSLAKSTCNTESGDDAEFATLRRGLAPFILRRTKEQVLTDLPEKNEQTLYCDLLPKDRKQYDDLRTYYRHVLLKRVDQSGMNKSKMHILEALLRLRQAACHPGLIDKKLVGRPSAKLDALVEQVTEVAAEGHKALVFSQFTSLLAIVRDRLDTHQVCYEYLDGRTRKRQERVDRFQTDPECSAFLISLKAGGTGLNLTAADYVFLLDPWWNPAVEAQAIDRAHRIGQTRRVFAYRLIARDTVEEKVLELQSRKRKLADAIVAGNGAVLGNLTVDDLQLLLS